jgi:1-deoxy-D-xylulose-5-phosphate reductoisomerase
MKYLTILGSTGSIGVNTLNVVRGNPHRYQVVALAAGNNAELLQKQIIEFKPQLVAVKDETVAARLQILLPSSPRPEILFGSEGYRNVAVAGSADMVVSALAGAAGLLPTWDAIAAGKDIALANKEVMVMAGDLVMKKARATGSMILPVDSEHSAIFQCLLGHRRQDVKRIILTASGGPFLRLPQEELVEVTPSQALNHPNWRMGKKISVDSATMMNKGLEIIEARWLFDIDFDNIHVYIHPQSIVHSFVEYLDGCILAQLGTPDMKTPISYALSFPERLASLGASLDLLALGNLEFIAPDFDKFPSIQLAYQAGRQGGTMPAVLNAANELAVQAFLEGKIRFTQITKMIEATLSLHSVKGSHHTIADILTADRWARETGSEFISRQGS